MDSYTATTLQWLDNRFDGDVRAGTYHSHQPIYGFGKGNTEPGHLVRFVRTLKILGLISQFEFENAIDIGGGEGYLAGLIRDVFSAEVLTTDLSSAALVKAWELFGLQGVGIHAAQLPFADNSFDLVVCSEVLEHVEDAVSAIMELDRICRKYIVITTLEACVSRLERWLRVRLRDFSHEHYEINWWHPTDFEQLLNGVQTSAQVYFGGRAGEPINEPELLKNQARQLLREMGIEKPFGAADTVGIIVWKDKSGFAKRARPFLLEPLIDPLFAGRIIPGEIDPNPLNINAALIKQLRCPVCLGEITRTDFDTLECRGCARSYIIKEGVPLMYPDGKRSLANPTRGMALRNLFRRENVATSSATRRRYEQTLKFYYRYHAFRIASPDEKLNMIARRLRSG